MLFFNHPIAELMHGSVYLVMTYWKRVYNYIHTSEGSNVNVHQSDSFGILVLLSLSGRRFLCTGKLIQQMLSIEELLIVLRWQINFDRDQKMATIDQTTHCSRLVDWNELFGHLFIRIIKNNVLLVFWSVCWSEQSFGHLFIVYKDYMYYIVMQSHLYVMGKLRIL